MYDPWGGCGPLCKWIHNVAPFFACIQKENVCGGSIGKTIGTGTGTGQETTGHETHETYTSLGRVGKGKVNPHRADTSKDASKKEDVRNPHRSRYVSPFKNDPGERECGGKCNKYTIFEPNFYTRSRYYLLLAPTKTQPSKFSILKTFLN